jgi:hypothetical protein
MGAGVAKELWDLSGRGDPSWKDLAWDGVGTAAGLVTAWCFDRWWRARTRPLDASGPVARLTWVP